MPVTRIRTGRVVVGELDGRSDKESMGGEPEWHKQKSRAVAKFTIKFFRKTIRERNPEDYLCTINSNATEGVKI